MSGRAALRLAVVVAVALLIWLLRPVTVPLFAAYLLALMLMPLHQRLRRRIPSAPAAAIGTVLAIVVPLLLLLPAGRDVGAMVRWIADADVESLRGWFAKIYGALLERLPDGWAARLGEMNLTEEQITSRAGDAAEAAVGAGKWVAGFVGGLFGILSFIALLPIFLYYLLEGAPWPARLRGELPKAWQPRYDRVVPRIEEILCAYTRARLVVALVKGGLAWAVLALAGFPGAYTLALLLGLFSILPVIGPFAAWIAVAGVGIVDGGATGGGLAGFLLASGLSVSLELIEGYVLLPRIVGRELGLSDFAVVLAMLGGGILFGFLGVLIAVPLVAVAKVFYAEYVRPVMKAGGKGAAPK
jgi:predicted PurR-regulated permease PerM